MSTHPGRRITVLSACTVLILGFAFLSCDSDSPGSPAEDPPVCSVPDTVDFGVVTLGSSGLRTFDIENTGEGTLSGTVTVSSSSPCEGYLITSGGGEFNLSSGHIRTVAVRLEPPTPGFKTCRISTGNGLCGDVVLVGSAESPTACAVQPTDIDFGTSSMGVSRDTIFTITNSGGGVLTGRVRTSCGELTILSGEGLYELSAGEVRTVAVRFTPAGTGVRSCIIETGNTMCGDVTVSGFVDPPNVAGAIVGHGGVILRSTDGGATWSRQTSGTNRILVDVQFLDENTGMVVGQNGTILKTTDGGATWDPQISGTTEFLSAVSFVDADTATAVGQNGTIVRSTDGGVTWNPQVSNTIRHLVGVFFTDGNTGTAVGWYGVIRRTTNGGATWTVQNSGTNQFFNDVWLVDRNHGTAVCGGSPTFPVIPQIVTTSDGGENWFIYEPSTAGGFTAVAFVGVNFGWVVDGNGNVFRTTDGGINWTRHRSGVAHLNAVSFVDADNGVAVGPEGIIVQTTDGGRTWASRPGGLGALLRGVVLIGYQ